MRLLFSVAVLALVAGCLGGDGGETTTVKAASTSKTSASTVSTASVVSSSSAASSTVLASTTSASTATSTSLKPRECRLPYVMIGYFCCPDRDGDGVCDFGGGSTTSTTTLSGFEVLFGRVANRTFDLPLPNETVVNRNEVTTTTVIPGITGGYNNTYRINEFRGCTNWGGVWENGTTKEIICHQPDRKIKYS